MDPVQLAGGQRLDYLRLAHRDLADRVVEAIRAQEVQPLALIRARIGLHLRDVEQHRDDFTPVEFATFQHNVATFVEQLDREFHRSIDPAQTQGVSTGSSSNSVTPTLERHSELWFEDGNIVLRAQNTIFRVHRSLLSMHSPVFRDLFALAQQNVEEQVDGTPVVLLHNSPLELGDLLSAIYGGSRFLRDPTEIPEYAVLQSLIRLGRMYQIDELYNNALRALESLLPGELTQWDRTVTNPPVDFELADTISMVKLTRELDRRDLYVRAMYHCCQLDAQNLVEGIQHSRGTLERLDPSDLIVCMNSRQRLLQKQAWMIHHFFTVTSHGCQSLEPCGESRRSELLKQLSGGHLFSTDILAPCSVWDNMFTSLRTATVLIQGQRHPMLCAFCSTSVTYQIKQIRLQVFRSLDLLICG